MSFTLPCLADRCLYGGVHSSRFVAAAYGFGQFSAHCSVALGVGLSTRVSRAPSVPACTSWRSRRSHQLPTPLITSWHFFTQPLAATPFRDLRVCRRLGVLVLPFLVQLCAVLPQVPSAFWHQVEPIDTSPPLPPLASPTPSGPPRPGHHQEGTSPHPTGGRGSVRTTRLSASL